MSAHHTSQQSPYPSIRWAILAGCCLAGVSFQLAAMSYAPLFGVIAKDLGIAFPEAVQLMTYFMLFSNLSFFISGPFIDRFTPAISIIVSIILSFVPTLATLWVGNSYASVAIIRILQGCAVGFCMAATVPLIMQWFPGKQRAFALGITGAFIPLGAMLSVVIAPVIYTLLGNWKLSMAAISLFALVSLIYCLIIFSIARNKAPLLMDEAPGTDEIADNAPGEGLFKAALLSRYTWIGIAATFAANWALQSVFSLTPSYFSEPEPIGLGLGPIAGGSLTAVLQVASVIAPVVGGYIAGKYFNGRPGGIIMVAMVLTTVYGAIQFQQVYRQEAILMLCLILPGFGIGMLMPMLQAKIAESYDHRIVGRMNGLWLGIGSFGGTVGLFVSAKALAATGNYISIINIIALVALIGLILSLFLNRRKEQKESHPTLEANKN
ncbi:sugar phosphate permease [Gibbsiella quercinecans]|nr:MFS transporter [Gibbsiella quercinecans]TCT86745.1 sugar phosphate permease [Gibbsiella quercinecans]